MTEVVEVSILIPPPALEKVRVVCILGLGPDVGRAVRIVLRPLDERNGPVAVVDDHGGYVEVDLLGVVVAMGATTAAVVEVGADAVGIIILVKDQRLVDVSPAVHVLPAGFPGAAIVLALLDALPRAVAKAMARKTVINIHHIRAGVKVIFLHAAVQCVVGVADCPLPHRLTGGDVGGVVDFDQAVVEIVG